MKQEVLFTNWKCFTSEEANEKFMGSISSMNWDILISHITIPELACFIEGFTEQSGVLFFLVDGEMISVGWKQSARFFRN